MSLTIPPYLQIAGRGFLLEDIVVVAFDLEPRRFYLGPESVDIDRRFDFLLFALPGDLGSGNAENTTMRAGPFLARSQFRHEVGESEKPYVRAFGKRGNHHGRRQDDRCLSCPYLGAEEHADRRNQRHGYPHRNPQFSSTRQDNRNLSNRST